MIYTPESKRNGVPQETIATQSTAETISVLNILRATNGAHRHRRDLREVLEHVERDVMQDIGADPGLGSGRNPEAYVARAYRGTTAEVILGALEETYLSDEKNPEAQDRRQEAAHMLATAGLIDESVATAQQQ